MLFGTVSGTTAGVYVGADLVGSSVAGHLFDSFLNNLYVTGIADSKSSLVQVCDDLTGNDIFGLIAVSSTDFGIVHDAVGRWSNGTCVDTSSYAKTIQLSATNVSTIKPEIPTNPTNGTTPNNSTVSVRGFLRPRADCRTVTVDDGDDCGKLVTRCGGGLTAANFYKYNPDSKLCSTLQPGQRVCCTAGELPDIRPKQNADGSCHAYQIKQNDFCNKIATANGLTVKELESFNQDTWANCLELFFFETDQSIQWGQCGTTTDFCIDTNTGPPGTAKKGTYGCISNCGMTIVQSGPPAQFIKLGYFEGFNLGSRDCLNMDATQVDPSFTHLHFAFGMISDKFEIYQENELAEFQFKQFKKIKGPKRIISFGGWVFSAEAPNYPVFRNGVKAENRNKLADNLVKYVVDNDLDGLDLDWEYPSAPDLPDIPAGDVSEATDYLRLLALLRSKLPKGKTLSIAAPASFWYLKQFPIKAMAELLDYIVYMTYDLHGQWDAGNQWASPGCPTGNCLRSHINRTETMGALTMITKAGVPSNKVLVGVSSYGRSFQMVDPSCTGPNCQFTGDRTTSYARKGRCTQTGGYIANAELSEIGGRTWTDTESNSKIMVDGDLWVSYMDNDLKESRTQLYKRYNMGGTIDWAVDLVKFHDPPNYGIDYEGIDLGLSWAMVKQGIKSGKDVDTIGCESSRGLRTGTWVTKQCTIRPVTIPSDFTPTERWEALGAQDAWTDAVRDCDDLAAATNCESSKDCVTHNTADDEPEFHTGAASYEVWNSIASLHRMIKNYFNALINAGNDLKGNHEDFIATFAPKRDDGTDLFNLLLTLIPIPINTAAARFFGGAFMTKVFFQSPGKANAWEAATSNIVNAGASIAKDALSKASDNRAEVSFNAIYDTIVTSWKSQTNLLLVKLFEGDEHNIKILTDLISEGKMIKGGQTSRKRAEEYDGFTASWKQEKNIERAFYAAAIPAAWTANRPAPVVVDFGNSCEIDARDYFTEEPKQYNVGWRCPNGHSYILAGVRDGPQGSCGPNNPGDGGGCNPTHKWTLDILDGIAQLQDGDLGKWGGVTVDDLIIGAVNTFEKNGRKNVMDATVGAPDIKDKSIADEYKGSRMDVRRGGLIRIPVCSAEEATANLNKGRQYYGDSPNYPCNP
ncbi:Killer toxin subunits alpha/beta [Colletotrichum sp. SAR 10_70]|nr:Killer toxin subunits alpha/beta [Colletotrichum sp. SAR 10_71]KAI8198284.1 Killer toxin subunits alpha/beta [Colletotrichum sp. SAR 10_70]KAJ5006003.1 Killer toxin subunits alpha/beta [Colletotrichum sp. SAR 10_66]